MILIFFLVERYPFEDHNAPPIQLIVDCCNDIHDWLSQDENNVVGINCKAGKGRTGLIICCYLMHSKVVSTSDEAMVYYGTRRTKDGKGVTIASQKRYVKYYEEVLKLHNGLAPEPRLLKLAKVKVETIPNFSGKPFVSIEIKGREVCISPPISIPKHAKEYEIPVDYPVFGDVKIQLCARKSKKKHQKMCHVWFSTAFVDPKTNTIRLEKKEIDVANKDKKCSHFKEDFKIEVTFEDIEEPKKKDSKKKKVRDSEERKSKKERRRSKEKVVEEEDKVEKDNEVVEQEEDFGKRRKRAQSFYDIEEDEDLSDSEKDEKELEQYFVEEDDEDEDQKVDEKDEEVKEPVDNDSTDSSTPEKEEKVQEEPEPEPVKEEPVEVSKTDSPSTKKKKSSKKLKVKDKKSKK